jgi:hypothetical protein
VPERQRKRSAGGEPHIEQHSNLSMLRSGLRNPAVTRSVEGYGSRFPGTNSGEGRDRTLSLPSGTELIFAGPRFSTWSMRTTAWIGT